MTPVGVEYNGRSINTVGTPPDACLSTLSEAQRENIFANIKPVADLSKMSDEAIWLHLVLPVSIREHYRAGVIWVLLLDAQIATSASGVIAIRVLDHGVREDRTTTFVAFLVAPHRAHILNRRFLRVNIVTRSTNPTLTPIWVPGDGGEED
ncbi:hypothetical protein BDM02DRAFT_3185789 [Thelephora ganbajun]|uniref:Uncharacterized protein n=1 Tax=Thelephora ganbajun TaxID=370292 RepID=A0ACB6ZKP8_THEGA|nr:hypothetical protein BDM02DRAFT_3185789 [Thelephora ganbajun]